METRTHPPRLLVPLIPLIGAVVALLLSAGPAAAEPSSGYCRGSTGPRCHFQYAKVLSVDDGDTMLVDVAGDGTPSGKKVRFNGINAMEIHRYSDTPANWTGECHSVAAGKLVYTILKKARWRVRLAAQDLSSRSSGRLRRQVSYRDANGRWQDLEADVLRRGLALFDGNGVEWAWNRKYAMLAQQAAAAHLGLFDTASCGTGPAEGAQIRVYVKWDADGVDGQNMNGEWARIRNRGSTTLNLGGWWFRDSTYRGYKARGFVFPAGTKILPGGKITLHAGCGIRTGTTLYWCESAPIWDNAAGAPRYMGDGGYLFDPQGDLRAWMTYACYTYCADPLGGKLRITAAYPKEREYVDVKNVSARTVRLEGALLVQNPDSYAFGRGDVLGPGKTLRLWMTSGSRGAAVVRSWRLAAHQLTDGGDRVELVTYRGRRLACRAWGSRLC